jgi:dienelactone hydrolase
MFSRPRDALGVMALGMAVLACSATPVSAAGRLVAFTSTDGTPLTAMLYEASPRPAPAVVLVHMLGRSKDEWSLFAERLQDAGLSSLALDLRGHGRSGGNGSELGAMSGDVQAAAVWLASQPSVRPGAVGLVGASLGANLVALAAVDTSVRAAALISPSLEYRGVRLDAGLLKKYGDRPLWLAASSEDPYALRTIRELAADHPGREQYVSTARAHGTALLSADQALVRALLDWLKRTLIF